LAEKWDRRWTRIESLLAEGGDVNNMNAAIFDAANNLKDCIAGIHKVMQWQGLMFVKHLLQQ
jgi:hypothetical protein